MSHSPPPLPSRIGIFCLMIGVTASWSSTAAAQQRESQPAESEPAESQPAETQPAETQPAGTADVHWNSVTDEQGVSIAQGDQAVLFYQVATKSRQDRTPRAGYVHPLFGLSGEILTEDFPDDHWHHRGIFWSWHQVWVGDRMLGDPWLCTDFQWDVVTTQVQQRGAVMDLSTEVHWKSPEYRDADERLIPIVRESTKITVHGREATYRCIDFDIALVALVEQVRIGGSDDMKGYGGFSPRIRLNRNQVFSASTGVIKPTFTAMDLGNWVDIRDDQSGITIIVHRQNPIAETSQQVGPDDPPQAEPSESEPTRPWILRRARSMQNAVYPGRHPVAISMQVPTRLRYRLLVHDGTLDPGTIEDLAEPW